jgi:hypothetical protein
MQVKALLPCRECGAPARAELFPTNCGEEHNTTIWLCSKHQFFGGDCPSDTAYLTEDAWNTRPDVVEKAERIARNAYASEGPQREGERHGDHVLRVATKAALSAAGVGEMRKAAFEEAARIAEADNTPGYGPHRQEMESLAEQQRRNIAAEIRRAALGGDHD